MKKNTMNFWIDVLIFIDFILVAFTGIVLREFPNDLSGCMVLGVPRKDLVDLHWVLSISITILIFVHLVLHWGWAKASSRRHIWVGPKTLAFSAIMLVVISMIVAPVCLTKDLPTRQEKMVTHLRPGPSPEIAVSLDNSVGNGASLRNRLINDE